MGELRGKSYPLALCDDDLCPWKHAGVTAEAAEAAAAQHVIDAGHSSTLYDENSKRVGRMVAVAELRRG
jgi:hypothetical protein